MAYEIRTDEIMIDDFLDVLPEKDSIKEDTEILVSIAKYDQLIADSKQLEAVRRYAEKGKVESKVIKAILGIEAET